MNTDFLSGPAELFEDAGREQLAVLLEHGLTCQSTILDIGCGCLRAGRWIIPLLDHGHYFGIDPMKQMVEKGLQCFVDAEMVRLKEPCFDYNDHFDFSVFNTKFTHFIARSIWTHASKQQIEKMLTGMMEWGTPEAIMLASFYPASPFGRKDYQGSDWIGRSHESEKSGIIAHKFSWIAHACRERGFIAKRSNRPPLNGQVWVVVQKI